MATTVVCFIKMARPSGKRQAGPCFVDEFVRSESQPKRFDNRIGPDMVRKVFSRFTAGVSICGCWLLATSSLVLAQGSAEVKKRYEKFEHKIPMRDGTKLFTSIYVPRDKSKKSPFLIERTPYSVAPYGETHYPESLGPSSFFFESGYIFVHQDVRGCFMSGGKFQDLRPYKPKKRGGEDFDESSDAYDTIDWLLENVPNNNGKAGVWGISYPGFYATMSLLEAHPALKAASPQAPVTDWFLGDDCAPQRCVFSLTGVQLRRLVLRREGRANHALSAAVSSRLQRLISVLS